MTAVQIAGQSFVASGLAGVNAGSIDTPPPTHLPPVPGSPEPGLPPMPDVVPPPVTDPLPANPPAPVRDPPAGVPPPMRA